MAKSASSHAFSAAAVERLADREDAVVEPVRVADDAELVRVDRAVLDPAVPVQVEHAQAVGLAALEAGKRVELAADVIAVLADQDVEPLDREVAPGLSPSRRRRPSGISVACGESIAPVAIVRPFRSPSACTGPLRRATT